MRKLIVSEIFIIILSVFIHAPVEAADYQPPSASAALVGSLDLAHATPVSEEYRLQFVGCDGQLSHAQGKDTFRGKALSGFYRCSTDPTNLRALLRLPSGAIYWDSKMALDVDGSWAAWNSPGHTDLRTTSYTWPGLNSSTHAAQVDPDLFPFIVMPTDGLHHLTGADSPTLGKEFARKTGLGLGDMGIVIYKDRWTPAFIADGGPFMRLGEASSRVFETLGQTRCKKWDAAGAHCIGTGGYPYRDFGIGSGVIFVVVPGSAGAALRPENAIAKLCAFASEKLGLTGSPACP